EMTAVDQRRIEALRGTWLPGPKEIMSPDLHPVRLCEGDHLVAWTEFEGPLIRTNDGPLHRVLRLNHVEIARQCSSVGGFAKMARIHRRADQHADPIRRLPQRLGETRAASYRPDQDEDRRQGHRPSQAPPPAHAGTAPLH